MVETHLTLDIANYSPTSGSAEYIVEGLETDSGNIAKQRMETFKEITNDFAPEYFIEAEENLTLWMVPYKGKIHPSFKDYYISLASNLGTKALLSGINGFFNSLYSKFIEKVYHLGYQPTRFQNKEFSTILKVVSEFGDIETFHIDISADEELLLIRSSDAGLHYMIVGKEVGEVFYGFTGRKPGNYRSLELNKDRSNYNELLALFLFS